MSTSSQVSLGALRLAAQEASDLENNPGISTEAWNQFISQSHKFLYDQLVGAYGNDYHIAKAYQFTLSNSQLYVLPDGSPNYRTVDGNIAPKFYKETGLDLQYSSSPNGWVTVKRFEWIERNKFALPNTTVNWNAQTSCKYTLQGNNLYIVPVPQAGQVMQLWYVPAPTNLQYRLPAWSVTASNVLGSLTDTTGLTVGMQITANFTQGILPQGTTITAVGSTTVTMSNNALSSQSPFIFSAWNDAALVDGISGWDQFIIVDCARKAMSKKEFDASDMKQERDAILQNLQAMAEARDAGQAFHVSDVLGASNWGWEGGGGCGDGWGW
jgi:hypothetical protein